MSGLDGWLSTLGYAAVALFVGVEGIGIPIPGETMLIAAAVFAAEGHLSIAGVILAAAGGAVAGNCLGFGIGWFGDVYKRQHLPCMAPNDERGAKGLILRWLHGSTDSPRRAGRSQAAEESAGAMSLRLIGEASRASAVSKGASRNQRMRAAATGPTSLASSGSDAV